MSDPLVDCDPLDCHWGFQTEKPSAQALSQVTIRSSQGDDKYHAESVFGQYF